MANTTATDGGSGAVLPMGITRLFLLHAIVAVVFGLTFLLVPNLWADVVGWGAVDVTITRLYGAGLLAIAWASWLGYGADTWSEVRLLVMLEVAFPGLTALAGLYELLLAGAPAFTWVIVVITGAFTVGFGYYARELA